MSKRGMLSLLSHSVTGTFGFAVIFLSFFLSIFAFFIIPDKTRNANHQTPELSLLHALSKVKVIHSANNENDNTIKNKFFGKARQDFMVPILDHKIKDNRILYTNLRGTKQVFTGDVSKTNVKSKFFLFGSDRYGRDVFSRVILGLRVSLLVGLFSVLLSLSIGIIIGLFAGYFGGWFDQLVMFIINTLWSIPTILLVFAIVIAFGRGVSIIFLAVGLTLWIDVARIVRGQTKSIKEENYIQASRLMGVSSMKIVFGHILPNIINPIIVMAASNFAIAILIEAGLSYLGFGVQAPIPSLGNILNENYAYAFSGNWAIALIPALFIMILVLSFNFVSYTLGDWSKAKQNIE